MVVRYLAKVKAAVQICHETLRRINLMVKSFASTELSRVRFSHAPQTVSIRSDIRLGNCGVTYSAAGGGSGRSTMYVLIVVAVSKGH